MTVSTWIVTNEAAGDSGVPATTAVDLATALIVATGAASRAENAALSYQDPLWENVRSKPTTVAGYGITDAYTKTEADAEIAAVETAQAAINTVLRGLVFTAIAATTIPSVVMMISTTGYSVDGDGGHGAYVRTASSTYDATSADGAHWAHADDVVRAAAFGVVVGDRAAAAANTVALQTALDRAIALESKLALPAGTVFLSGAGIVQSGPCVVEGAGPVGEWNKAATSTQGRAATTLVFVGTGTRSNTVPGISSMEKWGGGRVNPSARSTTHNDGVYKLLSFVTPSASATGRTLRPFSCCWHVAPAAGGSRLADFRLIPDYGGTDGDDGYRTSGADITTPLAADWDIGLWADNTRECVFERVQSVGQWRMTGLFGHACAAVQPASLYKNTFIDCTFSGYHGTEIRSYDAAPVVATTTTSIDIPWADDHPFGADGDMTLLLSNGAWPNDSVVYTFTTMEKVTGGSYDILRISGISPDVPSGTHAAFPAMKGGGTSHTYFIRGEIQGFQHPSKLPCHIKGLAGVAAGVFDSPGGCLFISGTKVTEIHTRELSLTTYDEIAVHVHDCRDFAFDGYIEMNGDRGRVITSPAPSLNTASLAGFSIGGAQAVSWIHRGSTITDGSLDTRPALPTISATPFTSDSGLMEPYYMTAPADPGVTSTLDEGAALLARPGGRAGIGRRTTVRDFDTPSAGGIDWAVYYDASIDAMRQRKLLRSNSKHQASIGSYGGGEFAAMIAGGFASESITIADDAVGTIAAPRPGGVLVLVEGATSTVPSISLSGMAAFDAGSTPGAAKWAGGGSLAVASGTAAFTGTTGTDGNVTVGCDASGNILIENRSGASRTFSLTFLGA